MALTFIDLFCGMGTARLGFEQAGWECVYSVEWDKHKRRIYEVIFGKAPEGKDIKDVKGTELPKATAWVFGFPCQDISVAGKQTGFDGHRSSLYFEVMRLLSEIQEEDRPQWLIAENVKNFLSVNNGYDFLAAQVAMDALGYDCEWNLLNSKNFGVPQNRERVFLIGHSRRFGRREVFPLREGNGEVGDEPRIKIIGSSKPQMHSLADIHSVDGICSTLASRDYKGPKQIAVEEVRAVQTPDRAEKRQNGRRFKEDGEPMFTLTVQDRHGVAIGVKQIGNCMANGKRENPNQGRVYDTEGLAPTLSKMEGGGRQPMILEVQKDANNDSWETSCNQGVIVPDKPVLVGVGVANTLDTRCEQGTVVPVGENNDALLQRKNGTFGKIDEYPLSGNAPTLTATCYKQPDCIRRGYRIRRLSPIECFRLQGLPDEVSQKLFDAGISDTQCYRAAGDAMTVNVLYEIAKSMKGVSE